AKILCHQGVGRDRFKHQVLPDAVETPLVYSEFILPGRYLIRYDRKFGYSPFFCINSLCCLLDQWMEGHDKCSFRMLHGTIIFEGDGQMLIPAFEPVFPFTV